MGGSVFSNFTGPNSTTADVIPGCVGSTTNFPCSTDGTTFTNHFAATRSVHVGGAYVGFGDGSVKFISEGINTATWQSLGTRNGGEISHLGL